MCKKAIDGHINASDITDKKVPFSENRSSIDRRSKLYWHIRLHVAEKEWNEGFAFLKGPWSDQSKKVQTEFMDQLYLKTPKEIEMNLKRIRTQRGLSQAELSVKSGVNHRMIYSYESGYKDINKAQAETLYKLATVLECSMEDLVEKKDL